MIAIYTRLSIEDDESNSIDNQKREGVQYAKLNGITDSQIFYYNEGEGLKGSAEIDERPALKSMMKDIRSGKIKIVWARKQSRLSRKLKIFNSILEAMIEYDIKLYMGDRGLLDLQSPMTKMMLQIMAAFDEYAPNQQSTETKKSLLGNFNEGKVWGSIPYGYRSGDDMMPYVVKEEALIINRIFNEYLSGKSTYKIAQDLNTDNILTKFNGYGGTVKLKNKYTKEVIERDKSTYNWVQSSVRNIIYNSWYNGVRTYSGMEGKVPRIVDEILFNKVQKAIESRKGKRSSKPKYNFLLKGLIRCEKCGRNYYGRFTPDGNDNYYQCSGSRTKLTKCGNSGINIPKLESFIIKHLFKTKDLFNMIESLSNNNEVLNHIEKQISELESILSKKISSVKKYAKLLGDELKGDEEILNHYINAKKQVSDISDKLVKLKTEQANLKNSEALNNYKEQLKNVGDNLDFTTLEIAVNNLIENIKVTSKFVDFGDVDDINPKSIIAKFNKKQVVTIMIEYKGLSEINTFQSPSPYKEWLNTTHFSFIEEVDKVNEEPLNNIVLAKKDIVRFNSVIKKT